VPGTLRARDKLLSNVPDFPFKPRYRTYAGLRLAHVDEGKGPPVVFIHGEPTWSFLWRKVIPPIRDAGYRCIAPDLPGFGPSDKPLDVEWYTYDRHAESVARLFAELKLRDATIVVHDWGGPIGLRVAVENPSLVGRMVILDTRRVHRSPEDDRFLAGLPRARPAQRGPPGGVPDPRRMQDPACRERARRLRGAVPQSRRQGRRARLSFDVPHLPADGRAVTGQRVLAALGSDRRPKLIIWGEADSILPVESGWRFARAIGAEVDHVIKGVGHYLQEDAGHQVGRMIVRWLKAYVPAGKR
jgi:haloalkane dehalogenase